MKSYALALLAASVAATTWEQDSEILGGVFWGIMQKESWDQFEVCAQDADIFATSILHSFQLMAQGDIKSMEAGIKLITQTIASIPIYTLNCHSMHQDMVEFEQWASLFLDPATAKTTIKSNLKKHLPALTLDLKRAKKDLANEQYFQAGVQLGTMVVILTTPEVVLSDEFWTRYDNLL